MLFSSLLSKTRRIDMLHHQRKSENQQVLLQNSTKQQKKEKEISNILSEETLVRPVKLNFRLKVFWIHWMASPDKLKAPQGLTWQGICPVFVIILIDFGMSMLVYMAGYLSSEQAREPWGCSSLELCPPIALSKQGQGSNPPPLGWQSLVW